MTSPFRLGGPTAAPPPSLSWEISRQGECLQIALRGDMDENAGLIALVDELRGEVILDLRDVRRINSAGVREWVNFVREANSKADALTLQACSPAIVVQINMIYNFVGGAHVASFFAPYVCLDCDVEKEVLIELGPSAPAFHAGPPEYQCNSCGEPLEFDDVPERYFAFLARDG